MNGEAGRNPDGPGPAGWGLPMTAGLAVLALAGLHRLDVATFFERLAAGRAVLQQGLAGTDPLTLVGAGQSWRDVYWLYDLLALGAWSVGGAALVTLIHVALVVGAFAVLAPLLRRHASPLATGFSLLLATAVLLPVFDPGPWTAALLPAALLLRVLDRPAWTRTTWILAILIQVVWINLAPSGWMGPLFALGGAAARRFEPSPGQANRPSARHWILPAVLLAACLLTPFGPLAVRDSFATLITTGLPFWISPLAPLFVGLSSRYLITAVLGLLALGLIAQKKRLPILPTGAVIVGVGLVLISPAHLPELALYSFVFLAMTLEAIAQDTTAFLRKSLRYARPFHPWLGRGVLLAACLAVAAFIARDVPWRRSGRTAGVGVGQADLAFPTGAAEALQGAHAPVRIVHSPVQGGFLAWTRPGVPAFADLRHGLEADDFTRLVDRFFAGESDTAAALLDRWQADAVLFDCAAPGAAMSARNLLAQPQQWALAYFDGLSALVVRRRPESEAFLENRDIQQAGVRRLEERLRQAEEQVAAGRRLPVCPDLIGAGAFLLAVDRPVHAERFLRAAWKGVPEFAAGAVLHGQALVRSRRGAEAVDQLEASTRRRPDHPQAWHWYAAALEQAGRTNEAEQVRKRAPTPAPPAATD